METKQPSNLSMETDYSHELRLEQTKTNGIISLQETIRVCALEDLGFGHLQFLPPSITPLKDGLYNYAVVRNILACAVAELLGDPKLDKEFRKKCDELIKSGGHNKYANIIPDSFIAVPHVPNQTRNNVVIDKEVLLLLWGLFLCTTKRRDQLLKVSTHSYCCAVTLAITNCSCTQPPQS